jgi:hypothetical protein
MALQVGEGDDDAVEQFFLFAQFLGALGVVPDAGVFQAGVDGSQTFEFGIEVKDTPVNRGCGRLDQRGGCQWR